MSSSRNVEFACCSEQTIIYTSSLPSDFITSPGGLNDQTNLLVAKFVTFHVLSRSIYFGLVKVSHKEVILTAFITSGVRTSSLVNKTVDTKAFDGNLSSTHFLCF